MRQTGFAGPVDVFQNEIIPMKGTGLKFSTHYSKNNNVRENTIMGAIEYGIYLSGGSSIEFQNNELTDCGFFIKPDGGGNYGELDIYDSNFNGDYGMCGVVGLVELLW